jgi:RNA polymerase sigma-70 factor (ECF subfamily)
MNCNKDEYELLSALTESDEAAFKGIYDKYSHRIFTAILPMVKCEATAKDLVQEIFIKLWNKRQMINPKKPFFLYLLRIAENTVFDFFRKAARDKALKNHLLANSLILYSHIEETLCNKENISLIQTAIDQLPPQRRKIFELCKVEGLSYEEVSSMLGISVSTISDHIVKANNCIRNYLSKQPELYLSALLILFFC